MCISCQQPVRPRQEGLQCDDCLRSQHRTCNTGVSQFEYRDAVKTGTSIDWSCLTCDILQTESTALSEISVLADPDVRFNSEQNSDQGRHYYNLRKLTNITKCCSPHYKMRKLDLLQYAAHFITQCAHYYKMLQPLLKNT